MFLLHSTTTNSTLLYSFILQKLLCLKNFSLTPNHYTSNYWSKTTVMFVYCGNDLGHTFFWLYYVLQVVYLTL